MKRNYRKKEVTPEPEAATQDTEQLPEDEDARERRERVEAARELQKIRQRGLGVNAESLAKAPKDASSGEAVPSRPSSAAESSTPTNSVERQFMQQSNTVDVDKHMVAYVEEQMRLKRGADQSVEKKVADPIDELYRSTAALSSRKDDLPEGGAALSAALLAQVPEVDLGVDSKIKNIEATEIARREYSERSKVNNRAASIVDILPGNMTSSFKRRSDNTQEDATDEQVMERFKKRFAAMEQQRRK